MNINVNEANVASIDIYRYIAIIEAVSKLELCQTVQQQLHILMIKVILNPKNAIKLQKKYGYGFLKMIL